MSCSSRGSVFPLFLRLEGYLSARSDLKRSRCTMLTCGCVCGLWVQTDAGCTARQGPPEGRVTPAASCWGGPRPRNIKAELSSCIGRQSHWSESTNTRTGSKVDGLLDPEILAQPATFLPAYLYCSVVLVEDEGSWSHAPSHKMTEQLYQHLPSVKFRCTAQKLCLIQFHKKKKDSVPVGAFPFFCLQFAYLDFFLSPTRHWKVW